MADEHSPNEHPVNYRDSPLERNGGAVTQRISGESLSGMQKDGQEPVTNLALTCLGE